MDALKIVGIIIGIIALCIILLYGFMFLNDFIDYVIHSVFMSHLGCEGVVSFFGIGIGVIGIIFVITSIVNNNVPLAVLAMFMIVGGAIIAFLFWIMRDH